MKAVSGGGVEPTGTVRRRQDIYLKFRFTFNGPENRPNFELLFTAISQCIGFLGSQS